MNTPVFKPYFFILEKRSILKTETYITYLLKGFEE